MSAARAKKAKSGELTAMRELLEKLEQAETGRQQAVSALGRLERAVETMHIGVTITDPDGKILYTNGDFCQPLDSDAATAFLEHHPDFAKIGPEPTSSPS